MVAGALDGVAAFVLTVKDGTFTIYVDSDQTDAGLIHHHRLRIDSGKHFDAVAVASAIDGSLNGLAGLDGAGCRTGAAKVQRRIREWVRGPPALPRWRQGSVMA